MRNRCQEVVLDFLVAGGRINQDHVHYGSLRLPRAMFSGRDLAGVGYVRRFTDYGGKLEGPSDTFVTTLPNNLRFEARANTLLATLGMLVERFVDEEYAWLDSRGRVVIDVGANIADSVVYFSNRGAAYVYGYEPDPIAFAAAQRNLDLNGIHNVMLSQVAVQGEARDGRVAFADVIDQAGSEHPGLSIVCKIDCEGCEYEIFAPGAFARAHLDGVLQIMIEYHWRSPEILVKSLETAGFQVETAPGSPGVGWIRARRPV
jgi:hypothetical protein